MDTPINAREQLEDLIMILANAWLQKMPHNGASYDVEINNLLSLSLRSVHDLLAKNILKEMPAGSMLYVSKERLLGILAPPEPAELPKPKVHEIYNPPLKDEANGKTFIEGWSYRECRYPKMDRKLYDILRFMWQTEVYIEDVTTDAMEKFSKSKLLWQLFVKKRGY